MNLSTQHTKETDQESQELTTSAEEKDNVPTDLSKDRDTSRTSPYKDILTSETANSHEYDGKD